MYLAAYLEYVSKEKNMQIMNLRIAANYVDHGK